MITDPRLTSPTNFPIFFVTYDACHVTHDKWMWHVIRKMHGVVNIGAKCEVTTSKSLELMMSHDMRHVTSGMWHMTCDTHGMLNIVSNFQVPSSNGLTDCFVSKFPLYSYLTSIYYIQFYLIFILLKSLILIPTG